MYKSKAAMENANSRIAICRPNLQEGSPPQIVILADDLTGACDSAAAFLGEKRRARVWLQDGRYDLYSNADVWSFSTESRNEVAAVAAKCVKKIAEELRRMLPAATFFKKVDSAGRGHFGEEMEAARVAIGADVTVYAPAFPAAGRCVLNGELHVWDATGKIAKTRLRDILPPEMEERTALIPAGRDSDVEKSLVDAIARGRHILLCDAGSSVDLERVVRVARTLPLRMLWAGSAGLGIELARTLAPGIHEAAADTCRGGKTLIFCGTPHPLTRMQMDRLSKAEAAVQMHCVVASVRCGVSSDDELRRIFSDAGQVGSLVLTGGDTAAMVLRALDTKSIEVAGEMATGVPWGILHGGLADGCIVVTKSGGFGDEQVLINALHFCRGVAG